MQSTTYLAEFGGGVYAQAETVNGIRIAQQTSATAFTSGTAKNPLPLSVSVNVNVLCTWKEEIKTSLGSMFFLNDII